MTPCLKNAAFHLHSCEINSARRTFKNQSQISGPSASQRQPARPGARGGPRGGAPARPERRTPAALLPAVPGAPPSTEAAGRRGRAFPRLCRWALTEPVRAFCAHPRTDARGRRRPGNPHDAAVGERGELPAWHRGVSNSKGVTNSAISPPLFASSAASRVMPELIIPRTPELLEGTGRTSARHWGARPGRAGAFPGPGACDPRFPPGGSSGALETRS